MSLPDNIYLPLNMGRTIKENTNKLTQRPNGSVSLKEWLNKYGPSSDNIYNIDGSLTADRTVNLETNSLSFIGEQTKFSSLINLGTASAVLEIGKDLLGLKDILGLPTGIHGGGLYYFTDDDLLPTNTASVFVGDLSEISPGAASDLVAVAFGVGDFANNISNVNVTIANEASTGNAFTANFTSAKGTGEALNRLTLITETDDKAIYRVVLDEPSKEVEFGARIDGFYLQDVDLGSGYKLPWTDGTTGQVLTTDGAGQAKWRDPLYKPKGKYDDDADAGANGVVTGEYYITTGLGAAPLNVAGILMAKQ